MYIYTILVNKNIYVALSSSARCPGSNTARNDKFSAYLRSLIIVFVFALPNFSSLAIRNTPGEDSDQTVRMRMLL